MTNPLRTFSPRRSSFACALVLAGAAASQTTLVPPPGATATFGDVTTTLSDGRILVADTGWNNSTGRVSMYQVSGVNTTWLMNIPGVNALDRFGSYLSDLGDIDGNGNSDFGVGAFGASSLSIFDDAGILRRVLSGTTGFAHRFMSVGDLNDDGRDDLIVSETLANPTGLGVGRVYLYATTGAFSYWTPNAAQTLGPYTGSFGYDLDFVMDGGTPRVLVGTPYEIVNGIAGGRAHSYPIVPVLMGGRPTWNVNGQATYAPSAPVLRELFGWSVAFINDANSSGNTYDVAIGIPYRVGGGEVNFFDQNGTYLSAFNPNSANVRVGNFIRALADTDGDQKRDLLVSEGSNELFLVRGVQDNNPVTAQISKVTGQFAGGLFGVSRSNGGNLVSMGLAGNASVLHTADYVELGGGCSALPVGPSISFNARPLVGTAPMLTFSLPGGYPNGTSCLVTVGTVPVAPVPFSCGSLWTANMLGTPVSFMLNPNGTWSTPVPISVGQQGVPLVVQGAAGPGLDLTNAIVIRPGNY